MNFVLVFDRNQNPDPLNAVIVALRTEAEAYNLHRYNNTTIEFEHDNMADDETQQWIDDIVTEIGGDAYVKIYRNNIFAGEGNPELDLNFQTLLEQMILAGIIPPNP